MNNRAATNTIELGCPECHGRLRTTPGGRTCSVCGRDFINSPEGRGNLLLGDALVREDRPKRDLHLEKTVQVTMEGYFIHQQRGLFPDRAPSEVNVLEMGCGRGKSVDLLDEAGYGARGMNSGVLHQLWNRRNSPKKIVVANVNAFPFATGSFDFISCARVTKHMGRPGAARGSSTGHEAIRFNFSMDNIRFTSKSGYPKYTRLNRLFLFDLFHRNTFANQFRFRWPWYIFSFRVVDLGTLFFGKCGCKSLRTVLIDSYGGFLRPNRISRQRLYCGISKIMLDAIGC